MYADRAIITVCCEQTKQNDASPAANMTDNDPNTFWHSDYTDKWSSSIHKAQTKKKHYIQVDFTNPEEVKGFSYMPRSDNANRANGTLVAYTVELYGADGQVLKTITGNTGYTKTSFSGKKSIQFSQAVSSVKMMRVYFDSALYDNATNDDKTSSEFASCAEFKVLYSSATESEITVTTMTASEFVGHIDDFASEYDMIYISGTKLSSSNPLITGADELRYSHVGSGKQITVDSAKKDKTITGLTKLLGQLDIEYDDWFGKDGVTRRFAPISTYGPDGGGYYRGSGNDMTSNQCDELLDFVKSGYPVIVGDALISNGKVNTVRVDNSSWYYQFLSEAINYQNVLTAESLNENSENLAFFANLAKPTITFVEKPAEPVRAGESNVEGSGYIDGELKYVFTIGNDSDAAPASTTYDCKLYIDLNFDGNLSQKESQDKYMILQDEDGNVLSKVSYGEDDQRYELQAGKKYTLTRKIPESYFKLITWKLEVSSNQNHYIHTSQQGYAKQKNTGSKQPIKVLQLLPQKANQGGYKGGSWVLDDQNGTFQRLIKQIDDFDIQIDTIYVKNPADDTKKRDVTSMKSGEMKELLKQYQMLVIGFNDNYQDIPNNNGQVEDILDFIKNLVRVFYSLMIQLLFINYDRDKMYGKIASTAYGVDEDADIYFDNWIVNIVKDPTWGLSLNTILRSVVGMDRYGITSDEEIDGKSITSILKKGQALDSQNINFGELMKLAGDVAWKANSNRSSSYAQTQAYSNHMMAGISLGASENLTTKANRINDGAITEYPYRMSSIETGAGTLTISSTHGQYYQLGLEQDRDINGNSDGETDVVVWYCLTGNSVYNASPNDARNSYYFYSKGNVIYTGPGHSQVNQESEIKLFINAMVAAANVTAVDPEVNFVEELNPTADIESTRYYSTDQSSWTNDEANVLEQSMDFYVNVKDYNMVSADLNQDDLDKQEMTLEFFIDSDDGEHQDGADGSSNMTNITKAIGSLKGYDGTTAEVGSDGAFHLTQNTAYQLTLSNLEQYLKTTGSATSGDQNGYRKDCKLHVKVTSTVYLYGEPKVSTKWASIDLKQRQLFELN